MSHRITHPKNKPGTVSFWAECDTCGWRGSYKYEETRDVIAVDHSRLGQKGHTVTTWMRVHGGRE